MEVKSQKCIVLSIFPSINNKDGTLIVKCHTDPHGLARIPTVCICGTKNPPHISTTELTTDRVYLTTAELLTNTLNESQIVINIYDKRHAQNRSNFHSMDKAFDNQYAISADTAYLITPPLCLLDLCSENLFHKNTLNNDKVTRRRIQSRI